MVVRANLISKLLDKGMKSADDFAWIDERQRDHFVTAYSPYFAQEVVGTAMERSLPVDARQNWAIAKKDREADQLVTYRTTSEFLGKTQVVVVKHHPSTMRKQD